MVHIIWSYAIPVLVMVYIIWVMKVQMENVKNSKDVMERQKEILVVLKEIRDSLKNK